MFLHVVLEMQIGTLSALCEELPQSTMPSPEKESNEDSCRAGLFFKNVLIITSRLETDCAGFLVLSLRRERLHMGPLILSRFADAAFFTN